MLWTQALRRQFVGRVELLAAHTVEATIGLLVDVSVGRAGFPELLRAFRMARVGAGADELVERQIEQRAQALESRGVAVHQFARADALGLGGLHVFQTVLI